MRNVVILFFLGLMALSTGCASIVSKSDYPVTITSTPSGVTVTVEDSKGMEVHRGTTPTTVTLSASKGFFSPASYLVKYHYQGEYATTVPLKGGMDGWYIGNLLFGGLIGMLIVDPATGAMWKLDDTVHADLTKPKVSQAIMPLQLNKFAAVSQAPQWHPPLKLCVQ